MLRVILVIRLCVTGDTSNKAVLRVILVIRLCVTGDTSNKAVCYG